MSQVEFNDENKASVLYSKFQPSAEVPTLVRYIMSAGIAKSPAAANGILIGIAVVAIITTLIVVYKMNSGGPEPLSPAERQVMEQTIRAMQNQPR